MSTLQPKEKVQGEQNKKQNKKPPLWWRCNGSIPEENGMMLTKVWRRNKCDQRILKVFKRRFSNKIVIDRYSHSCSNVGHRTLMNLPFKLARWQNPANQKVNQIKEVMNGKPETKKCCWELNPFNQRFTFIFAINNGHWLINQKNLKN